MTAAQWSYLQSYYLYFLAAFFDGITGSFIAVVAMCHSYATDTTTPGPQRAQAFGLFHGVLFAGLALGPSFSSFAISKTGNILTFFYVGLVLQFALFLYVLLLLPESLPKSHQLQAQAAHRQLERRRQHIQSGPMTWRSVVTRLNFLEPLTAFYPKDGTRPIIRRNLMLLGIMDFMAVSNSLSDMMVTLLFAEFAYHWNSVETGYYVTAIGITRMFVLFLALPFILRVMKARVERQQRANGNFIPESKLAGASETDIRVLRLSTSVGILGYIAFLFNRSPSLFLVCGIIANMGGASAALLESTISKHVPRKNTGLILGAVGFVHSLSRVVSPTFYLQVYSRTLTFSPKIFFTLFLLAFIVIFVLSLSIRTNVTGSLLEDGSDLAGEEDSSTEPDNAGPSDS